MKSLLKHAVAVAALSVLLSACGKSKQAATDEPAAPGAAPAAAEQVVNVYNWSDYIDPEVIQGFEQATGIKVRYDVFDSNEVLETKLLTGNSGYDVVVPSAYFLQRQVQAGVFAPLDKSKLPGLVNSDPELAARAARHDPGNAHSVVYMWGTTGIGYDRAKVKAIMPDAPVDSWKLIFDPAVLAKFKDCGVSMLDDPTDMVGTALLYLGKDPNSESEADLKAAEDLLLKIRPYLRTIHSSQYIDQLANGELCIVVGYSGDVLQARDRAEEAGKPLDIGYSIPQEGALMWFDTLAIPADAAHKDAAHQFIEYLLQPAVAAKNSDFVNYANANKAATPLVDPAITSDPAVYPDAETLSRMYTPQPQTDAQEEAMTRIWTAIKTGG